MMDASFQQVASIVLAGLAATYLVVRYLYRQEASFALFCMCRQFDSQDDDRRPARPV